MPNTKKSFGFTLIEILIVISIIGILAGILILIINPRIKSDQAKNGAARFNLSKLAQAIESYRASTGSYPTDSNSNGTPYDDTAAVNNVEIQRYLQEWPNNAPIGATYTYSSDANGFILQVNQFTSSGQCYRYCSSTGQVFDVACNALATTAGCNVTAVVVTPTPVPTPTPIPTPTPVPTPTPGPTPTPTPAPTPTPGPTPTPTPAPTCDLDGACEDGESCTTCSDCTYCGVSPNPSCPSDTPSSLALYTGNLWTTGSPPYNPDDSYQANMASPGRVSIQAFIQEGHPERGCPNASDPSCTQNQTGESVAVELDGTELGRHTDRGPNVHDWFLIGPFYQYLNSGNHDIRATLAPVIVGNSSEYRIRVCRDLPLLSTCINDGCNGGDTRLNCTSDCGPRTPYAGRCGNGTMDWYETCYDCSTDDSANVCTQTYPTPSFRACPSGYTQLGTFYDMLNPDSQISGKALWYTERTLSLNRSAELLILTVAKEGHPELGCPGSGASACSDAQTSESFRALVNGAEVGRYNDRGASFHGYTNLPNWTVASAPAGTITFRYEHLLGASTVNQSVDFWTTVCGR